MIYFKLLGGLDLRDHTGRGLDHVLAQPKRLALLAYLVLASPRGYHRRDKLLALLWPGLDGPHARNALSKAVHFLRRGLGEGAVPGRGDELSADPATISCDAVDFSRLVGQERLAAALELYQGDLLEGFFVEQAPGFEHWVDGERDRFRRQAALAARRLAAADAALGRWAEAAEWSRRELELHPDDEAALRRLVLAVHASGDRAGALREYDRAVRRLRAELEAGPSAETRAVRATIEVFAGAQQFR